MDILIIQVLRMGDALQLVPVVKGIKENFPQARLCMLTSTLEAKIFRGIEEIDEIHILDKESICEQITEDKKENILSALDQIKSDIAPLIDKSWDWVINFSHTFSSGLLSSLFNAKHRSGFFATSDRRFISKEKWLAYSLATFPNRAYSSFNWVDINANALGIRDIPHPPYLKPGIDELFTATSLLKENSFGNAKIIGMQPGASGDHKMWPVENFSNLGKTLVEKHGCKILIFGGEQERELGEVLKSQIGKNSLNLAGETGIPELTAFLSLCNLLVTNDTGPMHLASAVGTPVLALFFSTHFTETGPYGEGHIVIHPDIPCFPCQGTAQCSHKECLNHISPETVEEVILRRLSGTTGYEGRMIKDKVKTYYSHFDTWGFLDWAPFDDIPIEKLDLERLILKLSLLNHAGINNGSGHSEENYVQNYMESFSITQNSIQISSAFSQNKHQLTGFKELINRAILVALDIQSKLMDPGMDKDTLNQLGKDLEKAEKEISDYADSSPVSFLSELLAVLSENIEKTDHLSLSTKTIDALKNINDITDGMTKRFEKIKKVFKCYI